jgi:hypothetical protein
LRFCTAHLRTRPCSMGEIEHLGPGDRTPCVFAHHSITPFAVMSIFCIPIVMSRCCDFNSPRAYHIFMATSRFLSAFVAFHCSYSQYILTALRQSWASGSCALATRRLKRRRSTSTPHAVVLFSCCQIVPHLPLFFLLPFFRYGISAPCILDTFVSHVKPARSYPRLLVIA